MHKIILFLLVFYFFVSAQLSPGDLSRSHADLEGLTNCQKCHAMEQQISSEKCLDCHGLLAEQIKSGSGLHATSGHDKCQSCHAEHNGRDYETDLVAGWDREIRSRKNRIYLARKA